MRLDKCIQRFHTKYSINNSDGISVSQAHRIRNNLSWVE